MSDGLRDVCIILGIVMLIFTLIGLGVWISNGEKNSPDSNISSDEVLRMRMRDACLPGVVERGEVYRDGKHMVICTDGEVRWVEMVLWASATKSIVTQSEEK